MYDVLSYIGGSAANGGNNATTVMTSGTYCRLRSNLMRGLSQLRRRHINTVRRHSTVGVAMMRLRRLHGQIASRCLLPLQSAVILSSSSLTLSHSSQSLTTLHRRVITGSIARSATRRYLNYSEADFEVFRPAGATRCTDVVEIWLGGGDLRAKFHPIGATIRV